MTSPEPSTEDTTTAPEPAVEPAVQPPEGADPGAQPGDRQEARDTRVRAERDELRTERDALNSRVAGMQRAEIHRRAGEHLASPSDLDLVVSAQEYAGCFDESGEIDEGAVAALIDQVVTQRPAWRKRAGGPMDMGFKQTAPIPREASHAAVFEQARHR